MFKKLIAAILFAVLSLAPAAFACDPSFPNGISDHALTVHIEGCSTDNYTAKDIDGVCVAARQGIVEYLNAEGTKTWSYENTKNDANFIIYLSIHENTQGDDNAQVVSLKTFGLALTSDGHTLFTAVGATGNAADSFFDALDKFNQFVNDGWVCNQ